MVEAIQSMATKPRAKLGEKAQDVFVSLWASLFYSGKTVGKSLIVCAGGSGEGASTVACGLAMAGSAPIGSARVALVDFNLRSPTVHQVFGLPQSPGIGEIVMEKLPPESAAQRVCEGLDVYTAGKLQKRSPDSLRSQAVAELLSTLAGGYDQVIVDVAPVNQYPDAAAIVSVVKDAVLVAHTDRTPREAVVQAKKRLENAGGRLVGIVLNLRTYPIPKFLYKRV